MKKNKLLFIVNNAGFFISHRMPIAIAAKNAGYNVSVACPESDYTDVIIDNGLNYFPTSITRGTNSISSFIRIIIEYSSLMKKLRPDVVHLITSKPILIGGILSRMNFIPSVSAISGLGYLFTHDTFRVRLVRTAAMFGYRTALNHRLSHVIFQNTDDRDLFVSRKLVAKAKLSLIPGSGVNLEQVRYVFEPASGPITVVLPARMLRDKGVIEFVEAAKLLRQRGVACVMRLQGSPDPGNPMSLTSEDLRAWVAEGDIEWDSYNPNISDVLANAHIVALPSYYREGLPKSIVDAAAAGRPAVTTDMPGCREAIIPNETGFLVRPRDATDLADKIQTLVEDGELRRRMGAAARRFAEEHFDIRAVVAKHMEIYEDALATSAR